MKTKKKSLGSRSRAQFLGLTLVLVVLVAALNAFAVADQKKSKQKPQPVPDTLILVSTFAETGQTLRGVRVRLYPADREGNIVKGKPLDGQTNNMGEYPFHVPKSDGNYVLIAELKGFARTEKPVSVQGEDQLDIFLQMPGER